MVFKFLILATLLHFPLTTNTFAAEELPLVNPEGCNYFLLIAADEPELSPIGLDKIEESDIDKPYRMEIKKTEGAPADEIDSYPGLRAAMDAIKKYNGQRLRFVNFEGAKPAIDTDSEVSTQISRIDSTLSPSDIKLINTVLQNDIYTPKEGGVTRMTGVFYGEDGNRANKSKGKLPLMVAIFGSSSGEPVTVAVHIQQNSENLRYTNSPLLFGILKDGKILNLVLANPDSGTYRIPSSYFPKEGGWSLAVYGF